MWPPSFKLAYQSPWQVAKKIAQILPGNTTNTATNRSVPWLRQQRCLSRARTHAHTHKCLDQRSLTFVMFGA